jgi:SAM-dependent methyltransferase
MDLHDNIYGKPDLEWDGKAIPLDSDSVECALATEVFEHCAEPQIVLQEIARVLKPKGILFFTVPFLWPLHDSPHDEYRYTPFSMERHLRSAGFTELTMRALGGWDASLAQMIALWVKRRPMSRWKHAILATCATPLVSYLCKRDSPPAVYTDQQMITAIAGTAVKPAPCAE